MSKICSICGYKIMLGWFCKDCYTSFEREILAKAEWTKFLQNEEGKRRKRREQTPIYLGTKYDLDNDGNLISIGDMDG